MKPVCIIIPVYKEQPSDDEVVSIKRSFEVLSAYDFYLVCPEQLNISYYLDLNPNQESSLIVCRFPGSFFKSIQGYNRLLLSPFFYQRFVDYEYILICQPDAYIFKDDLMEWCKKKYDYVGAPLIGHYLDSSFSLKMRVGNGGLSLRRVQFYLRFFQSKRNVFSSRQIASIIDIKKKPFTRIFVWLLMSLGWRNKPLPVAASWKYNEDDFWSGFLDNSQFAVNKPTPMEAIQFSFERFPSELFELNGRKLPFGCHAWRKYQFESFWRAYIR